MRERMSESDLESWNFGTFDFSLLLAETKRARAAEARLLGILESTDKFLNDYRFEVGYAQSIHNKVLDGLGLPPKYKSKANGLDK